MDEIRICPYFDWNLGGFLMKKDNHSLIRKLCAVSLAAAMIGAGGAVEAGTLIGTSITANAVAAEVTSADSFFYEELDNGTLEIVGFKGAENDVVIPSVISGKRVTSIGGDAFRDCSGIESVEIPSSVTKIGDEAFESCQNMTSVSLPNSVRSIGNRVFQDCTSLIDIDLPDSITSIGENAFDNCYSLAEIELPDSITSIGKNCFDNCKSLISAVIPNSVTNIKEYTFYKCKSLSSINLPESITSIGEGAFNNAGLTRIKIPDSVTSIGSSAFSDCTDLVQAELSNHITVIRNNTFYRCSSLTGIHIPDGVISIGEQAFDECESLTSVDLPSGVKAIGANAFSDCQLDNVNIPDSVLSIGEYAFGYTFSWGEYGAKSGFTVYGTKDTAAEKYALSNGLAFKENAPAEALSNTAEISASSIKLGDKVTVNASAKGGSGDYTYYISYKKSTDTNWTVKQDYGTNPTVTIKPGAAAKYTVKVRVKDSSGTIVGKNFTVNVTQPLTNTSGISSTSIKYGEKVTVNASAAGGAGKYTYEVTYRKSTDTKWATKQSYGTNASVNIKPGAKATYIVKVRVKDADGTIVGKNFTVTVS